MSTVTSAADLISGRTHPLGRFATACEVLLVYAGILLYIWRWQFTYPWAWVVIFAGVILSHVLRGDTLRGLGLTAANLRMSASVVLPLALLVYLPVLGYALLRHVLVLASPGKQALGWFAGYGPWCVFQQYLMQSYFHNRLMGIIKDRNLSSLTVAIMFGGAHIPNPVLMPVTTIGGFVLARVFARYRNIWPLALAQTVGGLLVAAITPAALIHNMRVGPGYFFYGVR